MMPNQRELCKQNINNLHGPTNVSKAFLEQLAEDEAQLIDGIARVRERKGMTREQLSLAMGAPKNFMSKLESHSRGLEGALIVAIAKAMKMKPVQLFREALRDDSEA